MSPCYWKDSAVNLFPRGHFKLGTVIVLVALIIFSYGPHSNMHGGGTLCPWGGGVIAFLF